MSAQSEIRVGKETRERSDAINRVMKKYEDDNYSLERHVAKLHSVTNILIIIIFLMIGGVVGGLFWLKENPKETCEQVQLVKPTTTKQGGESYTVRVR